MLSEFPFAVSDDERGPTIDDSGVRATREANGDQELDSQDEQSSVTQRKDLIEERVDFVEDEIQQTHNVSKKPEARVTTLKNGPSDDLNLRDLGRLLYIRPIPKKLYVLERDLSETSWHVSGSMVLLFPNKGPKGLIPLKPTKFVRTVNDVTFENGMLTRWETDQPSVALAEVRIPVDVVSAFLGTIAEVVQLKVNISSKEQALAEAQAGQIQADAELLALRLCIEASGNSREDLMACLDE